MKKIILLSSLGLFLNTAFAQLSFDRTRIIFDHGQKNSQSVVVSNTNTTAPYLAQAWIENDQGVKVMEPLVALPILQRLNPKQEKQIKISLVGSDANLPKDRESMLFFNVLGVPPKDNSADNQLSVVIQSKLKLFYRPKGLKKYPNNGWINEMKVSKTNSGLKMENASPYHIVLYAYMPQKGGKKVEKDLVIKPFSTENLNVKVGSTPSLYFIDDFGSSRKLSYTCNSNECTVTDTNR